MSAGTRRFGSERTETSPAVRFSEKHMKEAVVLHGLLGIGERENGVYFWDRGPVGMNTS